MLVLLHSVEAVRKLYIAKQLTIALNSLHQWKIDDYTVDFSSDEFDVYDADNKLVFKSNTDTNSLIFDLTRPNLLRPYGQQLLQRIIDFYQNIVLEGNKNNHIKNAFGDLDLTLGLSENDNVLGKYDDIVNLYKNKTLEHVVLSGSFSKASVQKLRELIGTDLVVLNITRNPSSAYIVDDSHTNKSQVIDNFPGDLGIWLFQSLISSIHLKDLDYTTTVKYEDILVNKKLTFNGVTVNLPEYENYNDIISVYDNTNIIPNVSQVRKDSLPNLNTWLSDMTKAPNTITQNLPTNFFASLDYVPLDYNTIIGPKS